MTGKNSYIEQYEKIILITIAILAIGLRFWGIKYGLPHIYRTDEPFEVFRALRLAKEGFVFDQVFDEIGRGGLYYILFFEYGVYFLTLKVLGLVGSSEAFALEFVKNPTSFWLIGRATAALFGGATIFSLYKIGRRVYSRDAGLIAALFLAVSFLHARESHWIGLDIPMTFLLTVAFWYIIHVFYEGTTKSYLLSGLFIGLATTFKLPAIVMIIPLVGAHVLRATKDKVRLQRIVFSRELLICFASFAGIYILTNPVIIFKSKEFFFMITSLFLPGTLSSPSVSQTNELMQDWDLYISYKTNINLWSYYLRQLYWGLGLPLFCVSILGVLWTLVKRNSADYLILIFCIPFYVLLCLVTIGPLHYDRYLVPLIPFIVLLGARFLVDFLEVISLYCARKSSRARITCIWTFRIRKKQNGNSNNKETWRYAFLFAVAAIVAFPALHNIASYDNKLVKSDTRTLALNWIEQHIPPGSRILVGGNVEGGEYGLTVPLQNTTQNIDRIIEDLAKSDPGKANFWKLKKRVKTNVRAYDLCSIRNFERLRSIEYYIKANIEYIIYDSYNFLPSEKHSPLVRDSKTRFRAELENDPRIVLVKTVSNEEGGRLGPIINIYRIRG